MPEFKPNTNIMSKKFSVEAWLDSFIKETERLSREKSYGEGTPEKIRLNQRINGLKKLHADWKNLGLGEALTLVRLATNKEKQGAISAQIDIVKNPGASASEKTAAKTALFKLVPQLEGVLEVFGTEIVALKLPPIENDADQAFLKLLSSFLSALNVNWGNLDRGGFIPNTVGAALALAEKLVPNEASSQRIQQRLTSVVKKIDSHLETYEAAVSAAKIQAEKLSKNVPNVPNVPEEKPVVAPVPQPDKPKPVAKKENVVSLQPEMPQAPTIADPSKSEVLGPEVVRIPEEYLKQREEKGEKNLSDQIPRIASNMDAIYHKVFVLGKENKASMSRMKGYVKFLSAVRADTQDNYLKCVENQKALNQLLSFVNKLDPKDNELKTKIREADRWLEEKTLAYRQEQLKALKTSGKTIILEVINQARKTLESLPLYKSSEREVLDLAIKSAEARKVTSKITKGMLRDEIKAKAERAKEREASAKKESEANAKRSELATENTLVVEWLTAKLVHTENNRNPVLKFYHEKAFEGKDPVMAKIRDTARNDDIAFLQTCINNITGDKNLSGRAKLELLQGAFQYILEQMKKDRTFFTVGMDLFGKMLETLKEDLKTFQKELPPSVKANSELRSEIDVATAMEQFKMHVRLHSKDFGEGHALTQKIIATLPMPKQSSGS